jgi:hypothetical protein
VSVWIEPLWCSASIARKPRKAAPAKPHITRFAKFKMNSLRSKKSHINRYGMLTPGFSKALRLLRNRPSQTDRPPLIHAQAFADSGTYAKGMNRLLTAFRIACDDLSIFT